MLLRCEIIRRSEIGRLAVRFTPTELAGAYLIHLDPRVDERGLFARAFCAQEFAAQGLETSYVQANISTNARAGTVRGHAFSARAACRSETRALHQGRDLRRHRRHA